MRFSVSAFLRSTRSDQRPEIWTQVVYLVDAESDEEARQKAEDLARQREGEYETADGSRVRWEFVVIDEIEYFEDRELRDGMVLYSRLLRDSEAASLLKPFYE